MEVGKNSNIFRDVRDGKARLPSRRMGHARVRDPPRFSGWVTSSHRITTFFIEFRSFRFLGVPCSVIKSAFLMYPACFRLSLEQWSFQVDFLLMQTPATPRPSAECWEFKYQRCVLGSCLGG